MCRPLVQAIEAGKARGEVDRWAALEAHIEHFVEGGYVNWGFMRWLDPQEAEHWEVRNRRPRPSLRVFGRFAMPNVFVATHVEERKILKEKWSNYWIGEQLRLERIWSEIFTEPPFFGRKYEDYITENAARHVKV